MSLRIELKGRIELSSEAEKVADEIEEAFRDLEKFLERGRERYGEEAARLRSRRLEGRWVEVEFESGEGS